MMKLMAVLLVMAAVTNATPPDCEGAKMANMASGDTNLMTPHNGVKKFKCEQGVNGGGWTKFATIQSRSVMAGAGWFGTQFCELPEWQEWVDTCDGEEWIFSREMMINYGKQVMVREVAAPHKTFLLDFSKCTGEEFFQSVTGDYKGAGGQGNCHPDYFDFTANKWVAGADGWCNTNSHTQFNCVAQGYSSNAWPASSKGLRFHWGTRETNGDGGACYQIWDWWTGWASATTRQRRKKHPPPGDYFR